MLTKVEEQEHFLRAIMDMSKIVVIQIPSMSRKCHYLFNGFDDAETL